MCWNQRFTHAKTLSPMHFWTAGYLDIQFYIIFLWQCLQFTHNTNTEEMFLQDLLENIFSVVQA